MNRLHLILTISILVSHSSHDISSIRNRINSSVKSAIQNVILGSVAANAVVLTNLNTPISKANGMDFQNQSTDDTVMIHNAFTNINETANFIELYCQDFLSVAKSSGLYYELLVII